MCGLSIFQKVYAEEKKEDIFDGLEQTEQKLAQQQNRESGENISPSTFTSSILRLDEKSGVNLDNQQPVDFSEIFECETKRVCFSYKFISLIS